MQRSYFTCTMIIRIRTFFVHTSNKKFNQQFRIRYCDIRKILCSFSLIYITMSQSSILINFVIKEFPCVISGHPMEKLPHSFHCKKIQDSFDQSGIDAEDRWITKKEMGKSLKQGSFFDIYFCNGWQAQTYIDVSIGQGWRSMPLVLE